MVPLDATRDADDVARSIGNNVALAVVQEHKLVVPRIDDNRAAADSDIEGRHDDAPSGGDKPLDRQADVLDTQIGFRTWPLGLEHQLGLRVWETQASRNRVAPNQLVTERSVEGDGLVKLTDAKSYAVDLVEQRLLNHGDSRLRDWATAVFSQSHR